MVTADRMTAVIIFALGLAMLVGGYTMDRLSIRQIHPLSIPGLVPMILGSALCLCAIILMVQSRTEARTAVEEEADTRLATGSFGRLALTVVLTFVYALLLVDRLPFFWATALFLAAFTLLFSWPDATGNRERVLIVVKSVVFAGVISYGTVMLFTEAFLVRLP